MKGIFCQVPARRNRGSGLSARGTWEREGQGRELCACGAAASSMEGSNASCERVLFAEEEQVMAMLEQMAAPDCLAEGVLRMCYYM